MAVYLLWHTHEMPDGDEDSKLIGVYSSQELANQARARVLIQPGFRDAPEGLCISRYEVDEDNWKEGYVTQTHNDVVRDWAELHQIELVCSDLPRGRFRSVIFDFDGTLSLIREGWPQVMIPMMVGVLRETGTAEDEPTLTRHVEDFVMRLNGRQTIYQMIQLAEEVKQRGEQPLEPLAYKHRYHDLLMDRIRGRLAALEKGQAAPHEWTVPGSHEFLDELRRRGLTLYLASGTDVGFVRHEAELLGLTPYFGEHIYGALDDYKNFSKKMIIERILYDNKLQGEELLGFGDGFVEIEEVKRVGGVAVAVASDEVKREGINAWKRDRLIRAGADIVIGDYRQRDALAQLLFG